VKSPVIMVPQVLLLVLTLLADAATRPSLIGLRLLVTLVTLVLDVIVAGAYPSMVKSALDGSPISVGDAMSRAFHKFWTLLLAGILVILLVVVGTIALIVPGLIFVTWYAYTVPAIMLEDKDATQGMSASKAFGRDKKWSTFILFLVFALGYIVLAIIEGVFALASPVLGDVANAVLEVPLAAFVSVSIAYVYLTCGPSSVAANPEPQGFGAVPIAPPPPPSVPTGGGQPARYCANCGSAVQPGAKFCNSCGKPV
jgi:hypothetical protein